MQSRLLFLRSLSPSMTEIGRSDQLVQMQLENWLSKVSDGYHPPLQDWCPFLDAFGDVIKGAVPKILEFLKGSNSDVRSAGTNAVGKLAVQSKQWCLSLPSKGWCTFLATFHDVIKTAVPQIIKSLTDSDSHVRLAGANAIGKLAEQSKWWCCHLPLQGWGTFLATFHHAIGDAVPQIIKLLKDSSSAVQLAGVDTIMRLVEKSKYGAHHPLLQGLVHF